MPVWRLVEDPHQGVLEQDRHRVTDAGSLLCNVAPHLGMNRDAFTAEPGTAIFRRCFA
jgi:hypothetical protein